MANVIQLKRKSNESPARSRVRSHLDAYIFALAELEAGKAQIETNIRFVESVMSRTENSDLHAITLQQLADIRNQLHVASLKLLDAECGLLGFAVGAGIAAPSARSPIQTIRPTLKAWSANS
jgi:hypothetical protein